MTRQQPKARNVLSVTLLRDIAITGVRSIHARVLVLSSAGSPRPLKARGSCSAETCSHVHTHAAGSLTMKQNLAGLSAVQIQNKNTAGETEGQARGGKINMTSLVSSDLSIPMTKPWFLQLSRTRSTQRFADFPRQLLLNVTDNMGKPQDKFMNVFLSGWQTSLPTQGCKLLLRSEQETNNVTAADREGSGEQVRPPAEAGPKEGCRDRSSRQEK